jgi:Ca2+-transporting ATPase
MEQAINALGRTALAGTEHLHRTWTLAREYPLSRQLLAMSHAWRATSGEGWVVAAKGAPETIADLCHLDEDRARTLQAEVASLADGGFRVLAVAASTVGGSALPDGQHDFPFELVGLLGLADPIRPTVPAAVAECYRAGIRTVMITGDYPGTARSVAVQIGLVPADRVLTGAELDAMDDGELTRRIDGVSIFARVVPEQKLRLVRAFQATGAVTAMTGDGVNDAPALKAADIGIAMGGRGTDVAREAADLVLVDDDFSSIAHAVRLGRRVCDNIRKGMSYVVSVHVPIAGISLVPVLFGLPLVLLPVHIVFLELIIDPACSIAFEAEPEEACVMARPPRPADEPLLRGRTVAAAVLRGVLALAVVCGVLVLGVRHGYDEARCRTLAFSTLILMNLGLILASRSVAAGELAALRMPNRALWGVIVGALVVLAASLAWAPLRGVLHMAAPSARDLGIVLGAGVVGLAGLELVPRLVRSTKPA